MTRRILSILTGLLLAGSLLASTTSFATQRLREMSQYLHLEQLDTLHVGDNGGYSYRGKPLVVRVNEWREVEHIGLKLFDDKLRQLYPSPVYDFLERHLLERMAVPVDSESGIRMFWDKVFFNVGSPETALQIDTTATFTDNHLDLKVYHVAWTMNEKVILDIMFDMDWQLISGCTEIELEQNFVRSLPRVRESNYTWLRTLVFPDDGNEFITQGNFFITPFVQNNLYYTRKDGDWQLVKSPQRATQSVSNLALDANVDKEIGFHLIVDRYGYQRDTLTTANYWQFMQLCLSEGCVPYFGLKDKNGNAYDGTVFMVNRRGGYLHLLSVRIPLSILDDPKSAPIEGRLYAYIPLFNVSDKIINPQNYKPKTP